MAERFKIPGKNDAFQPGMPKRPILDFQQAVRQMHFLQRRRIGECRGLDHLNAVRHGIGARSPPRAVGQHPFAVFGEKHAVHAFIGGIGGADTDIQKRGAFIERTVADACNACGNGNALQSRIAVERPGADAGNTFRDQNFFQPFQFPECACADVRNAFVHYDPFDLAPVRSAAQIPPGWCEETERILRGLFHIFVHGAASKNGQRSFIVKYPIDILAAGA